MVPHPSTRHAHGCLASEIGRDPAFPTRYDRTGRSRRAMNPHTRMQPRGSGAGITYIYIYWLLVVVTCGPKPHRSYNQGLISADRSNKATLPLTIPRCLLSRLQRISRTQLVKLPCSDRAGALSAGPSTHCMVQAEAIDTRVIGQP